MLAAKFRLGPALRRWLVWPLLGVLATPLPSETPGLKRYLIDVWQSERGLPQNTVTGIAQTPDGYLWLSTLDGLARFDGVGFKMFKAGNTPALGSGRIRFLFTGRQGALWIATQEGGVIEFKDGCFTPLPLPGAPGLRSPTVQVAEGDAGALWLSAEDGKVGRLAGGQFSVVSTNWDATGRTSFQVKADAAGRLWAVSRNGLQRVAGEQLQPALRGRPGEYAVQCASRAGGWWIHTGGQVRLWRDGQWIASVASPVQTNAALTCGLEDRGGHLWLGSAGQGVFRCDTNGGVQSFTKRDGLSSDAARALFEDSEGNVWVGTEGGGLSRLRPPLFTAYGTAQGLSSDRVTAVGEGAEGELWVGTDGSGVNRLQGLFEDSSPSRSRREEAHFNLEFNQSLLTSAATAQTGSQGDTARLASHETNAAALRVSAVLRDRRGRVWIGARYGGVFRYEDGRLTPSGGAATAGRTTRCLFEDARGVVWIGQYRATNLVRVEGEEVSAFALPASLPPVDVRVMAEDAAGQLWFGTDGHGLLRWKDGQFTRFTREQGLGSDFIWWLHPEADGTLWIGTYGGGLTRLKNGRAVTCTTRHGLVDDVICHIADDGRGHFWFSSNQGIFRAAKRELNQFADGALERVQCVAYGRSDGLPTLECEGGSQSAGCRTRDGRLWFPTIRGLVAVDPAEVRTNAAPPPVMIEEMIVDGQPMPLGDAEGSSRREKAPFRGQRSEINQKTEPPHVGYYGSEGGFRQTRPALEIAPGRRRFEFHYTGLNFSAPEHLRFRHRLEGVDAEWVETGHQRTASYKELPRGTYTFHVQTCSREGAWPPTGASLTFVVLPFFWQTWWFLGLFLLTFGGSVGWVVGSVVRRRHQRHLRLLERLHAAERERTRIARDIHDDLGSSLTEISLLGALAVRDSTAPTEAREQVTRMIDRAQELARKLDETVWAVNPKNDSLGHLATYLCQFAREFLEPTNLHCRLDVAPSLPEVLLTTEVRHNVFLVVKEALHNAIQHAGASEVWLRMAVTDGVFTLEVADNGRGFSVEARQEAGNGLRNMGARMEEIGGRFTLHSSPADGTTVCLGLPLPREQEQIRNSKPETRNKSE
ncbi:MAG: ATP-binding protein [Verrucomicrobia bacterium]|nr:ATP-binding protein [Verrucomicrobiota bacterium]